MTGLGSRLFLLICSTALLYGCSGVEIATTPDEAEALRKIKTGQFELIEKGVLTQLRNDADIGKKVGRYELHRDGIRTWQLDTATGKTCLLSTSDADSGAKGSDQPKCDPDTLKPKTPAQLSGPPPGARIREIDPDTGKLRK